MYFKKERFKPQDSTTINTKSYLIINLIFTLVIVSVIVYAAMFHPESAGYPIGSSFKMLTGEDSISTGLSRSFSCIVRLDLDEAGKYNPYGLQLFVFFMLQLVFRVLISILLFRKNFSHHRVLVAVDLLQALVLFVLCFRPFLTSWFWLFG